MKKTKKLSLDSCVKSIDKYYRGEIFHYRPKKLKHRIPVIYVPGFSSNATLASKAIQSLGDGSEQEVISYFPEPGELYSFDPIVRTWQPEQTHNAAMLLSVIKQTADTRVDIVAHSEGALVSLLAAQIDPELFRSLTLVAPAGFVERDSHYQIVKRMFSNVLQYRGLVKKGNDILKSLTDNTLHYVLRYKRKAIREGLSIVDQHITRRDLKRVMSNNIKLTLILCRDDKVFPYELITNNLAHMPRIRIKVRESKEHEAIHSALLYDDKTIEAVVENLKSIQ